MKKPFFAALLAALALLPLAAQEVTDTGALTLLNTNTYSSIFGFVDGKIKITSRYITSAPIGDSENFGALGSRASVDTPLEFALLSYYSQPVINIRPVEADRILPANDPKLSGKKLGAAVLKELAELKFLDPSNTAAIGRYEGMIKFISDKNSVTRTEIQNYLRQGISECVDAELGYVSFMIDDKYNATLTYLPETKQYKLEYERPSIQNDDKEILAADTEDLRRKMTASRDFTADGIRLAVDAKAGIIPLVVYNNWERLGGANGMALIKETITKFYESPTKANYDALVGIYARCFSIRYANDDFGEAALSGYEYALSALSPEISDRIQNAVLTGDRAALARILSDPRYNIFTTPYCKRRGD